MPPSTASRRPWNRPPTRSRPMLSTPDADLARREPALPGLATLLDPDAFAEALRGAAPALRPRAARVTYVRYKPGTSCLVGYRVESDGSAFLAFATTHRADARDKWANGGVVLGDREAVVRF